MTSLRCKPRAYGGSVVTTRVTIVAVTGTLTGRFSFDGAMRRATQRRSARASACVYAAPVLTSLDSANAAMSGGGGSLTLMGVNFGAVDLTLSTSLTTADVCGCTSWIATTTLVCAPQAYGGSAVRTAVIVSAKTGTLTGQFSFDGAMRCTNRRIPRLERTDACMQRLA